MDSAPHFFPPVCVWPRSHDLERQQAPNLWKYFCCWWLLSGKKTGHVTLSLPTQATGSLHPGRKECVVAGNTLEKSLLIYSPSNKGPSFPQGPEDQNGLAAVGGISGSQRKFICSFFHSKSIRSGVWSPCEPVTFCLNDLTAAWVGAESPLSLPKHLKAQAIRELG